MGKFLPPWLSYVIQIRPIDWLKGFGILLILPLVVVSMLILALIVTVRDRWEEPYD